MWGKAGTPVEERRRWAVGVRWGARRTGQASREGVGLHPAGRECGARMATRGVVLSEGRRRLSAGGGPGGGAARCGAGFHAGRGRGRAGATHAHSHVWRCPWGRVCSRFLTPGTAHARLCKMRYDSAPPQ